MTRSVWIFLLAVGWTCATWRSAQASQVASQQSEMTLAMIIGGAILVITQIAIVIVAVVWFVLIERRREGSEGRPS